MNIIKKHKRTFVNVIVFLIVLTLIFIYIFFDGINNIINLIMLSFIIAYILRPLKKIMVEYIGIKGKKASLIIVLSILLICICFLVLLIPTMFKEINNIGPMLKKLSDYIENIFTNSNMGNSTFLRFLYEEGREKVSTFLMSFSEGVVNYVILASENILNFAVVPVITYYFLADDNIIYKKFFLLIPIKKRALVTRIVKDINKLLEKYIIGQLFLSLIVGVVTFIVLIILGVKFPIWLSILNGIFNIIPYFGPIFGGIPVVFVALIDSPSKGLWTFLAILIIQQVEGNILSPKITGDSTNMHPLLIIILLLIGETFGGFIGMILVVPIGVVIKVIYEDLNYYIF